MNTENRYRAAWAAWAAVGCVLEVWALRRKAKGDTLTEQVRAVLFGHPSLWWAGAGLAMWAFLHFFLRRR